MTCSEPFRTPDRPRVGSFLCDCGEGSEEDSESTPWGTPLRPYARSLFDGNPCPVTIRKTALDKQP